MKPTSLVSWTPESVASAVLMPYFLALATIVIPNFFVASFLGLFLHPLRYMVFPGIALSCFLWFRRLVVWIADIRLGLPLLRFREKLTKSYAYVSSDSQIAGIEPGTWIFSRKEYERELRKHPRRRGEPQTQPKVKFELCVAKLYLDGNRTKLALSSGETRSNHAASHLYYRPFKRPSVRGLRFSDGANVLEAAEQLADVARQLQLVGAATITTLADPSGDQRSQAAFMHAIRTGVIWGVVECAFSGNEADLCSVLSRSAVPPTDEGASMSLRLTPAGQIWLECSPESLRRSENLARMEKNRPPSMTFHAPVHGGVHTGPNYGEFHYNEFNYTETDVLKALDELLRERDIPWESDDLRAARDVIETAIDQEDTTDPELRSSLSTIFGVASNLGLAVAGNSIYDVLKHFILSMH
ncbi:hypothetical protein AB0C07_06005 [Actinoplanes missouriensis]|uniref:hypothetical protein n=1 Tax=Actinoplanes missouriensis TaxID=1866 RepID=UPI0033FCC0D7